MRALLITLLVLALVLAGAMAYLFVTTPRAGELLHFPLSSEQRALLAYVPESADAFALIPTAAALDGKLRSNLVAREAVSRWEEQHELPTPWVLGGANVVAWRRGRTTSYAVRIDRFRALLVRLWLAMTESADVRWDGSMLFVNDGDEASSELVDEESRARAALVLRLMEGLPDGDALVVQRERGRGAYPPIGRPTVTSIRVMPDEIVVVSRGASDEVGDGGKEMRASFPSGAMLAASFAEPPRILRDLNRLLGAKIDDMVEDGGSLALYDVDTGTLLPRPEGVLVFPAGSRKQAALESFVRAAEIVGETRETPEHLMVSFDRKSLNRYVSDTFVPATWPASRWAMRIDPVRMVPILRRLGDNIGLRFATPRIHRSARDLRGWIDAFGRAESVEASDSVRGGVEELRVRIASK